MAGLTLGPLSNRSVNVCVDMQRLFSAEGPWPTPWMEERLPAIKAVAERFPERTIFTRFIPPRDRDDLPGMWRRFYRRWEPVTLRHLDPSLIGLVDSLAALVPPAVIFDKSVYSPFARSSRFLAHLHGRGADTLIVTGAETDVCVLATVLGAVDSGLRVVVVAYAVCSASNTGHDALMTLYGERFGEQVEVADVETVLREWPS